MFTYSSAVITAPIKTEFFESSKKPSRRTAFCGGGFYAIAEYKINKAANQIVTARTRLNIVP